MAGTFDEVVRLLIDKLRPRQGGAPRASGSSGRRKLIFLIGAGCSMQYGLPSHWDLLYLLLTEKFMRDIKSREQLGSLQREIETPWGLADPAYRRDLISSYLSGVDGVWCLAYRRLARLLRDGLVDGVINLNFDQLFSDACHAEGLDLVPTQDLKASDIPFLVEPHGGIGPQSATPVLHLRGDHGVRIDPQRILSVSDVVVVGYGGGDDSVLDALTFGEDPKEGWGNLFLFSLEGPQEVRVMDRLLRAQSKRNNVPIALSAFDKACTFENLLESIFVGLGLTGREAPSGVSLVVDPSLERFTRTEAIALTHCRRLADRLRLASSVADSSPIEIAEHAREISDLVDRLAEVAGVKLLPHERVIVASVALFHDLGYYWGASHERYGSYRGWHIHRLHGAMASRMLNSWMRESKDPLAASTIPSSYHLDEKDRQLYFRLVLWLCSNHNKLLLAEDSIEVLESGSFPIRVRRRLLQVLISLAEHLALEHPFQPSLDPVHDGATLGTIDDPVLHLILVRRRGMRFDVNMSGGKIAGQLDSRWARSAVAEFFVSRIQSLVEALSTLAQKHGGRRVQFESNVLAKGAMVCDSSPVQEMIQCLEESLREGIDGVSEGRIDTHVALLDLLSIYCLGGSGGEGGEPRVDVTKSPSAKRAMERIRAADPAGQRKSLVQKFVECKLEPSADDVSREYLSCFEDRIFPAWRFIGKKWRDGIEAPTTALSTLEMGSSRCRSEVLVGLRKLLRDKVEWRDPHAKAHDGCVLCCSRLIMTFSYARLLFEDSELDEQFKGLHGVTLLDALRGLIRYFLSLDAEDPLWRGEKPETGKVPVHSVDYVAFAAGAIAFFISTDDLIRARGRAPLDLSVPPRNGSRKIQCKGSSGSSVGG